MRPSALTVWGLVLNSTSIALSCSAEDPADARALSFDEDAPTVVESIPFDGQTDVDPTLSLLAARFSESMHTGGWSWVTEAGRDAPEVTGVPFYLDSVTNLLPVRLQPSTRYVVWVNSPDDTQMRKFSNTDGIAARAYRIAFTTGAELDALPQ
jgi:hypothetical protein